MLAVVDSLVLETNARVCVLRLLNAKVVMTFQGRWRTLAWARMRARSRSQGMIGLHKWRLWELTFNSAPLESFHLFPDLPVELILKIWGLVCEMPVSRRYLGTFKLKNPRAKAVNIITVV